MRGGEDERSRALAVMHGLCWQDLIAARDIRSHLHTDNEQELNVFQIRALLAT